MIGQAQSHRLNWSTTLLSERTPKAGHSARFTLGASEPGSHHHDNYRRQLKRASYAGFFQESERSCWRIRLAELNTAVVRLFFFADEPKDPQQIPPRSVPRATPRPPTRSQLPRAICPLPKIVLASETEKETHILAAIPQGL